MTNDIIEMSYPIQFREADAKILGEHLVLRHNIELIGMKRVGISNFLRFFLYHADVPTTYLDGGKHIFIPVDLNDLVERELFPFWTLTFKRITDAVNTSRLPAKIKSEIESLFLSGIQSQDLFLLLDAIRQALITLSNEGYLPTIFFIRFDRIKDAANPAFFDNLQGLRDATHRRLAYVFTSFRRLDILAPAIFPKASLASFTHNLYIKPAKDEDLEYIFSSLQKRFTLSLTKELKEELFSLVSGNVQYLQLALIILHEKKDEDISPSHLRDFLEKDERVVLQSEELWESLSGIEKDMLRKIMAGEEISSEEKEKTSYLFHSGFIVDKDKMLRIFSLLFSDYIQSKGQELLSSNDVHFTKKEHSLMSVLEAKRGEIVTREEIIEAVWPESMTFGVSDWAIDRLVARVRNKLRLQNTKAEIMTIRTRGYKLQESA